MCASPHTHVRMHGYTHTLANVYISSRKNIFLSKSEGQLVIRSAGSPVVVTEAGCHGERDGGGGAGVRCANRYARVSPVCPYESLCLPMAVEKHQGHGGMNEIQG